MRVVHLAPGCKPVLSSSGISASAEKVIYEVTDWLERLNCHCHVIDIKAKPPRMESLATFHEVWDPPVPHLWVLWGMGKPLLFALLSLPELYGLLHREKIDVLHLHCGLHVPLAWLISRLSGKVPVVYAPHNSWLLEPNTFLNKVKGMPEVIAYKIADHIIADVPVVARRLVVNLGINPAKITIIYYGPEQDEIQKFMATKSNPHESNIVLCVAGIFRRKNQLAILKAVPKVIAAYPDVKFVFAGPTLESQYAALLQEFVAENGLANWVEFRGEVSKEELYTLYSTAIMFVYPSLADSQPQVVTEAIAFGLPLVASNIEPIADIISQNKESSILLDPNDVDGFAQTIIALLRDKTLRQSMAIEAMHLSSKFSFQHTAEQTLELYEKIRVEK